MNSNFTARGKQGEIWLYDPIGDSFWGDAISAKSFQKEVAQMGKVDSIHVHINSPGGDVFDGFAIYNQLVNHPASITVDVDGLAASIASIIAMSGNTIRMAKNALMMIHNPHGVAVGDETEMDRVKALLKTVKVNLAQTYTDRTGTDRDTVDAWMSAETWFTATDAVQYGFADLVTEPTQVSASFDLRNFRNIPDALRKRVQASAPTPALDARRVKLADHGKRVAALCMAS